MAIVLDKPGVDALSNAVGALQEWQYDGAPMQLHPGDLGWFWRFGAEATAAAVRTWTRDLHAQRRDDRVRRPVSTGRVVPEPGASRTPAIPPQQVGCHARLVDEHIAARVMQRLRVPPAAPRGRDVRAPLFVGVYRFF